ncbi:MAG: hypothetical protein AVDCRST_MAG71-1430, partial [uncultured Lysobacter sp.]
VRTHRRPARFTGRPPVRVPEAAQGTDRGRQPCAQCGRALQPGQGCDRRRARRSMEAHPGGGGQVRRGAARKELARDRKAAL